MSSEELFELVLKFSCVLNASLFNTLEINPLSFLSVLPLLIPYADALPLPVPVLVSSLFAFATEAIELLYAVVVEFYCYYVVLKDYTLLLSFVGFSMFVDNYVEVDY